MGVDVMLMKVHQPGTSRKRRQLIEADVFLDEDERFSQLCTESGLPMLSRVDSYGSLILTSVEMGQLIDEVNVLRGRGDSEVDRRILERVGQLARRCAEDSSMELHFEGE
ncbi:hypothetical protein [Streptomyces sp. NPDC002845]